MANTLVASCRFATTLNDFLPLNIASINTANAIKGMVNEKALTIDSFECSRKRLEEIQSICHQRNKNIMAETAHPELVEHSDVILSNCYPFWEGCPAEYALIILQCADTGNQKGIRFNPNGGGSWRKIQRKGASLREFIEDV